MLGFIDVFLFIMCSYILLASLLLILRQGKPSGTDDRVCS